VFIAYIVIGESRGFWPESNTDSLTGPPVTHAIIGMTSMVILLSQTIMPWIADLFSMPVRNGYFFVHVWLAVICYLLGGKFLNK